MIEIFENPSPEFAASALSYVLRAGGTVFACGNGGSMAHAQHFVAELIGCMGKPELRPMKAIALGTNPAVASALVNDFGGPEVFARELKALGRRGDVLVTFSTSGRSPNIIAAHAMARMIGMEVIAFGPHANPAHAAPETQEVHQIWLHRIAERMCDIQPIDVVTSGCFDLRRAGHVDHLQQSRKMGDHLIVLLNSDQWIRENKRVPVTPQEERRQILMALECVDQVVIFDDQDPVNQLCRLRPQIFTKGSEWQGQEIIEQQTEALWGGRVHYTARKDQKSTTIMIREIASRT